MSGHSKWANIKRKKEANDKVKGVVFAKLSRLITLAVVEGGNVGDPALNFKLRLMIDKAKQENMPKENIKRAIEKGSGPDKALIKEVVYEGFAPYGIALMIVTTTDNSNRTSSEIRNILEKNRGKLGSLGSVSYLFEKSAYISIPLRLLPEDKVFELGDKINITDIDKDEEEYHIFFPFQNIGLAHKIFSDLHISNPDIVYKPKSFIEIGDESQLLEINKLIEVLEELDDVQRVFSNMIG